MSIEGIPEIQGDDIKQLELELAGPPIHEYLAVFIRDPQNQQQYWFRKIGVKKNSLEIQKGRNLPYLDVERYDMGKIEGIPCPESQLPTAVQNIARWEREIPQDSEAREIQAVVGVARYNGSNQLRVDEIVTLVGFRYHQIRTSYFS